MRQPAPPPRRGPVPGSYAGRVSSTVDSPCSGDDLGPGDDLGSGDDLVDGARRLAAELLGGGSPRWAHSRAVAARAASAARVLPAAQVPSLLAAAWLHDVGYAPGVRDTGFHPLDGARYLQEHGWPHRVCGLVAHHSAARFVAGQLGLTDALAVFDDDPSCVTGPLADALTWADQTTSPSGEVVDLGTRLADKARRHGPDSPTRRVDPVRVPELLRAVTATDHALERADRTSRPGSDERPVNAR